MFFIVTVMHPNCCFILIIVNFTYEQILITLFSFGGSALGPGVSDLADFPEFAKQQVRFKERDDEE